MTNATDQAIRSGARHVEESQQLAAGLTQPKDVSATEIAPEDGTEVLNIQTQIADMTLSMFAQGSAVRVRVGNPHNASELYEYAFASADEANSALLDAGILKSAQVSNPSEPAGTGIALTGITVEQLESAGLKRHGSSTL